MGLQATDWPSGAPNTETDTLCTRWVMRELGESLDLKMRGFTIRLK